MRWLSWFIPLMVLLAVGILFGGRILSRSPSIPLATARRGSLVVSIPVHGQVNAKRAHTIVAPRIRNIQITWLAPEGSIVKKGDPVVRFDATQQQADLVDNQSALRISETSLNRSRMELQIREKELSLELLQAQRKHNEMKHEAPRIAEEARLELELAELNAKARLDQYRSDVQKAEIEVQRAREKVAAAQRELDEMTLAAPIPGMVVYLDIWKGNGLAKVQEGDSPWPGQGLVNLPDLSEMILEATASEVEAGRIEIGQDCAITLDALPDTSFRGSMTRKGTLARKKEPDSKINVFDLEIAILDKDDRLKPGMSASARITVDSIDGVLTVPLEAVFDVDGRPAVYLAGGKPQAVHLGRRNDSRIEIVDGLTEGAKVCLADPTKEGGRLPGDRAMEPELNRETRTGSAAPRSPEPAGRRAGRGR